MTIFSSFSQRDQLYQTFFVYQASLMVGSDHFGQISAITIITTFIGVLISLWWGSIETNMKKIQPFIMMSKAPAPLPVAVASPYQSSYSLWAALKAAHKGHWVLACLSFGSFLTQIREQTHEVSIAILTDSLSDDLFVCALAARLRKCRPTCPSR